MTGQLNRVALGFALVGFLAAGPAQAQETKTYTYDALGRVTGVQTSGGPSSGTNAGYQYDPAGNRTNVTVSGSPNGNAGGNDPGGGASTGTTTYIVVPLNGFTLIPIQQ
jgi:YD repeat-containing protein